MAGSLRSERILNINDELARVQMNNKQVARYPPGGHFFFFFFIYLFILNDYSVSRILELSMGRASFTSFACLWGPRRTSGDIAEFLLGGCTTWEPLHN